MHGSRLAARSILDSDGTGIARSRHRRIADGSPDRNHQLRYVLHGGHQELRHRASEELPCVPSRHHGADGQLREEGHERWTYLAGDRGVRLQPLHHVLRRRPDLLAGGLPDGPPHPGAVALSRRIGRHDQGRDDGEPGAGRSLQHRREPHPAGDAHDGDRPQRRGLL